MLGRLLLLIALPAALALPGCFGGELTKCHKQQEYQTAKPGPRTRVPDDLEPLSAENRLPVPYGEMNDEPAPKSEPCLIEAPNYYDGPVVPPE
jgi:hypothetical protein